MDSTAQAEGMKRVQRVLIDPLRRLGLAKPSTLTNAGFEEMIKDLCERLAYMSELNLAALAEQVSACPGGKDRDRFPIANKILGMAGDIQPPGDDASPLIRAVFGHDIGADAIAQGWAPELLSELRSTRRWPGGWVLKQIKDKAAANIRHLKDIEGRISRGADVSSQDSGWRDRRLAVIRRCQDISELTKQEAS